MILKLTISEPISSFSSTAYTCAKSQFTSCVLIDKSHRSLWCWDHKSSTSQGPTPLGWLRGYPTSRRSCYRADLGISAIISIQTLNLRIIMKLNILRIYAFKSLKIACQRATSAKRAWLEVKVGPPWGGGPSFNWSPKSHLWPDLPSSSSPWAASDCLSWTKYHLRVSSNYSL